MNCVVIYGLTTITKEGASKIKAFTRPRRNNLIILYLEKTLWTQQKMTGSEFQADLRKQPVRHPWDYASFHYL